MRQIAQILFYAATALQVALCVRLRISGLHRSYPKFFRYALALAIESVVLAGEMFLMSRRLISTSWYPTWLVMRSIVSFLEVGVAVEIFRRWASAHRGIGRFGVNLLRLTLLVAVALTVLTAPLDIHGATWRLKYQITAIVSRAAHEGVAVFLLCTVVFFFTHGGPVARNLRRHSVTMLVFATANAVGYFAIARNSIMMSSLLLPAVSLLTQGYWIFALNEEGESVTPWRRLTEPEATAVKEWNTRIEKFADSVRRSWRWFRISGAPATWRAPAE